MTNNDTRPGSTPDNPIDVTKAFSDCTNAMRSMDNQLGKMVDLIHTAKEEDDPPVQELLLRLMLLVPACMTAIETYKTLLQQMLSAQEEAHAARERMQWH